MECIKVYSYTRPQPPGQEDKSRRLNIGEWVRGFTDLFLNGTGKSGITGHSAAWGH